MELTHPAAYQPRLTPWRHTWRYLLAAAISLAAWSSVAFADGWDPPFLFVVDLVLGAASFVIVAFRRRWPLTVALVTNLLGVVSPIAGGPSLLATFSVATRRRTPELVAVGVAAFVSGALFSAVYPAQQSEPWWVAVLFSAAVVAITLGWGMYVGSRRELFWTLRQRAERAEAEQELRADRARGTERARIAREMHDVLAHRISRISMHAGALAFRHDLAADQLRTGAAEIQDQANAALTDLRDVLGVLRDDGSRGGIDRPLPTYADIPALVAEAREAGVRVELHQRLAIDADIPEAMGRTLYRIVQEGITNVRKHAPGALLAVEVSGSPEHGVDIRLRNQMGFGEPTVPGAGLGLVGLTERAQLGGGRLEHRREGSAFVVHGWLPWAA